METSPGTKGSKSRTSRVAVSYRRRLTPAAYRAETMRCMTSNPARSALRSRADSVSSMGSMFVPSRATDLDQPLPAERA